MALQNMARAEGGTGVKGVKGVKGGVEVVGALEVVAVGVVAVEEVVGRGAGCGKGGRGRELASGVLKRLCVGERGGNGNDAVGRGGGKASQVGILPAPVYTALV